MHSLLMFSKTYLLSNILKVIYIKCFFTRIKAKEEMLKQCFNADLIIVNDVFYLTPTEDELVLIYKLMMFLQETRSIIIVTNRPLSSWKDINVDTHLIETLEKRLMQDAQIISLV
ncbi:MAG: ATP-binding protein [Bacillales bacterium]|nr:ATP-binding protein [Bacillales bacterium]